MAAATAARMREIDRIATEETGPSLLQMMENAGRSMAVLAMRTLGPGAPAARVLVVAGAGGNGAGGICAARHLASRVGQVTAWVSDPERLSAAGCAQFGTYRHSAGATLTSPEPGALDGYDLIVDAVLGYGFRGAPTGAGALMIERIGDASAEVLSLDLPSGLDPDSGDIADPCVVASATLTLHLPKPGLANPVAGDLLVADLGIPADVSRRAEVAPPCYGPAFVMRLKRA